jgi:hypothetical protein
MQLRKKELSVLVAAVFITAVVNIPVHAQDGDIYALSTTTAIDKGNMDNIILKDKGTLLDIISNTQNYGYEVAGKIYKLTDVNNQFNKNYSETAAQLQANVKTNLKAISYTNSNALVTSVTANSATSFQVKFALPLVDTSKTVFNVTREGIPVTLTTSWNSTNTVATLTYSSNLPQDTYAVDVKNGSEDLGSTNISVTAQYIGKIEITSTVLGVAPLYTSGGVTVGGNGYATYKVLDQYGNDITASGLAQGITWTCAVGTITANNGLLTITPYKGQFLTKYNTVTINGIDTATGITTNTDLTTP